MLEACMGLMILVLALVAIVAFGQAEENEYNPETDTIHYRGRTPQ